MKFIFHSIQLSNLYTMIMIGHILSFGNNFTLHINIHPDMVIKKYKLNLSWKTLENGILKHISDSQHFFIYWSKDRTDVIYINHQKFNKWLQDLDDSNVDKYNGKHALLLILCDLPSNKSALFHLFSLILYFYFYRKQGKNKREKGQRQDVVPKVIPQCLPRHTQKDAL